MSRPKYPWWGYVREILRRYPDYNGRSRGRGGYDSRRGQMRRGQSRLAVIGMVFFRKTHTLQGAALEVPCGYETAKRWQRSFLMLVAQKRGLLD